MNPYEESELEGLDLCCEWCGEPISTLESIEYDGLCANCAFCLPDWDLQ